MSIKDFSEKIKDLAHFRAPSITPFSDDLFLGLIIVLVAIGAFGLGRISKIEGSRVPIRIENEPPHDKGTPDDFVTQSNNQSASTLGSVNREGNFVASKTGKKYYYPWCGGAQKISPSNLIQFSSKAEAEARGYTPSSTCKGL